MAPPGLPVWAPGVNAPAGIPKPIPGPICCVSGSYGASTSSWREVRMSAGQPKALVPQDIRGVRQQQIGYLQDPQSFLKLLGALGSPQSSLQMQGADALGGMLR